MAAPSWMNKEFVEDILKKSENDDTIRVTEIDIKCATSAGDNYASVVHRIQVEIIRDNKTEKVSLISKSIPKVDPQFAETMKEMGIFENEISMMTNALKKMNELLGPDERLSPRHIFSCLEKPVLIMEDLAPLGFRMTTQKMGLDLTHCLLAIRNLAKFHASSVALCEKEPEQKTLYVENFYNENNLQVVQLYNGGVEMLGKTVIDWPELDKRYSEKILQLAPHAFKKMCEALKPVEDDFNVITHSDYWMNNMLFRYDQFGKPTGQIMLDFQTSTWGSPGSDLQCLMSTSLSEEVYLNHRNELLEEYRKTLLITMQRLGCKTPTPTLQELETAMKRFEVFGMILTIVWMPLLLAEKHEPMGPQEIFEKRNNSAYQNERYRKLIVRRLPEFEKNGLLDV